jgi:hypothetical protein
MVLLALSTAPVLAGFQSQVTFGTGNSPDSVAVADFNDDGRADLAVANTGSATVSVLLNTSPAGASAPTFATHVTFATGNAPTAVAAADLNDDGRPDLAVINFTSTTASVLLNTTTAGASVPSFAAQVPFAVGTDPISVAIADLNDDGRPDLAIANRGSSTVGVLLNTTASGASVPSFAAQVTFDPGSAPNFIAAADLNGDGRPDLAFTSTGFVGVRALLNTTSSGTSPPTFVAAVQFATGDLPTSLTAADLNSDGRPDIAATTENALGLSVFLNTTPTGSSIAAFSPPVLFNSGASNTISVAAADLNGDSKPDLAVAHRTSNTVGVLLNTTPPGSSVPTLASQGTVSTQNNPQSVAAADLSGDGRPDLAVANLGSASVSVLGANPSGTLQFSGATTVVGEGAGVATLTLTRSGSTDGQVSAIVTLTGGSASPGQDFTLAGPQTVTWADNDGADKTVTIPITQDQLDEGDELLQLTLSLPTNPFGATLGAQVASSVTITDDDPVALSIANVSVTEGNTGPSTATFTVSRAGSTVRTATVQYATVDGSAQAGSDYTATSGTLTFAPNEPTKTVVVPILSDTLAETDETFTVALTQPTNALLGVAQAVATIQNDDVVVACTPRPRVSQTVVAGGGALQVRIESTPLNTPANNPLQQIRLGAFQNAAVTLNGQAVTSGQTVTLPPNTVAADMQVQRVTAGQPTTVPFTVVDGCGEWQTFVGGGAAAGF